MRYKGGSIRTCLLNFKRLVFNIDNLNLDNKN